MSDSLILEGVVTTLNVDNSVNVSAMGPIVDRNVRHLRLRPFQSSKTYDNLKRHGEGVFHVTDDVRLIAKCAIGLDGPLPPCKPASAIDGHVLTDACRWYAFRVVQMNEEQPRTSIDCQIVDQGTIRDFFGFNRAKHAVLESAILATRIHFLEKDHIQTRLSELSVWVKKTGGAQEREAFVMVQNYVSDQIGS